MPSRPVIWLILSLLLMLALVGVWARSYRMVSAFAKFTPTARRWIGVARGELIYDSYTDAVFEDTSEGWQWLNYRASSVKRGAEFPRVLGFSFGSPRRQVELQPPLPVYRHFVSIPLWFVTVSSVAILLQGWRMLSLAQKRRSSFEAKVVATQAPGSAP